MERSLLDAGDITYKAELILDTNTMISLNESYVSRINSQAHQTLKKGGATIYVTGVP